MSKLGTVLIAFICLLVVALLFTGVWYAVTLQKNKRSQLDEMGMFKQLIVVITVFRNEKGAFPTTIDEAIDHLYGTEFEGALRQCAKLSSIHRSSSNQSENVVEMKGLQGEYLWYPKEQKFEFDPYKR